MFCWFGYKILQRGGGGGVIRSCNVCALGGYKIRQHGGGEGGRIIDPAAWGGVIRSCSGVVGGGGWLQSTTMTVAIPG